MDSSLRKDTEVTLFKGSHHHKGHWCEMKVLTIKFSSNLLWSNASTDPSRRWLLGFRRQREMGALLTLHGMMAATINGAVLQSNAEARGSLSPGPLLFVSPSVTDLPVFPVLKRHSL